MSRKKKLAASKQINFLKEKQPVSFVYCPPGESTAKNRTVVIINDILLVEFWVSKTNSVETMIIVGAKQIGVVSPERLIKSLVSDLIEQEQFAVLVDACGYTRLFISACAAEFCPTIESINQLCIDHPLYERLKDYYGNKLEKFGMYLLAAPEATDTNGETDEERIEEIEEPMEEYSPPEPVVVEEQFPYEDEDFFDDTGWMDQRVGEVLHLIATKYKDQVVINRARLNMFGAIAYRVTIYGRYMDEKENTTNNMAFTCNMSSAHIDFFPDPVGEDRRVTIYITEVHDPIMVSTVIDLIAQNMEHFYAKHIVPAICIDNDPTGTVSVIKPMLKYKCNIVQPILPSRPTYMLYEINAIC